jgi:hypothetical protein
VKSGADTAARFEDARRRGAATGTSGVTSIAAAGGATGEAGTAGSTGAAAAGAAAEAAVPGGFIPSVTLSSTSWKSADVPSFFLRRAGTLPSLYGCSKSHVEQRVCLMVSSTIAAMT